MERMELEDAIEISRILSKAPEERLPMILSVLEKADVNIEGLEELEEWKSYKDMNAVIDLGEFMEKLEEKFSGRLDGGRYKIPATDFSGFCREQKVKPTPVRRLLAKKGIIETSTDNGRTGNTVPARLDGKLVRCVIVRKDWETETGTHEDGRE